jgi:hypothetical protein
MVFGIGLGGRPGGLLMMFVLGLRLGSRLRGWLMMFVLGESRCRDQREA